MMPQPQQKPAWEQVNRKDAANLITIALTAFNGCFVPIIRSGPGTRAYAWYWLSVIGMWLYKDAAPCPEMDIYIPVWLMFVVMRRFKPNRDTHSRHQGYPWLARIITRNEYQARFVEPFIVMLAGLLVMGEAPAFGPFLIFGGISLFMGFSTEVSALEARKRQMEDAQWQGRQMADMQRGGTGWGD
jgi:hypothetical protein